VEWLALMQHYGAPTRLLDWTKSAYVAAFFAAESAKPIKRSAAQDDGPVKPFAIWAIDERKVTAEAVALLGLRSDADLSSRAIFAQIYRQQPEDGVYLTVPVQPHRMNERLTVQQGLFLCANNPLFGFHKCLKNMVDRASKTHLDTAQWLHKFEIKSEARLDVLAALNKMNISSATLFPGLDGFARSLRTKAEIFDWEKDTRTQQATTR
jgi:hypothetical protein